MEVKPGYKQTEVGVIPEDWDSFTIKDILSKNGGSVKTGPFGTLLKANEYSSEGVPVISVGEVGYGEIKISENTPCVPSSVVKRLREYVLQSGDIVFGRKGAVDRSAMVQPHQEGWFLGSDGIRLRLGKEIHPKFVSYQLQNDSVKNWLFANAIGTTMASLNQEILKQVILSIPPLPEQTAIATALSDVDALISGLARLIEKKRAIKQAAMQELLTGKRRLPGYSDNWTVNKVLDMGEVITGGTPPTQISQYWNGEIPWVTPSDIDHNRDIFSTIRKITHLGLKVIREIPKNSILITCIASIGKNAILREPGATNQQINSIVPNSHFSPEFLYYLFDFNKEFLKSQSGKTATDILSKKDFSQLSFMTPSLPEQTAIATVLSDMDAEISTLETRRAKTLSFKQGMMQELLTGRIRLV